MQKPILPSSEERRLSALHSLQVLDTPPEERFDRLTRLARRLFHVPIALVSLVDAERQWFKSRQGLDASQTPREIAFCAHTVRGAGVMVVPDARCDPRFADNPLVVEDPQIRFYAGHPLAAPDGSRIGTLCILDREPRQLESEELHLLHDLAAMVEEELATLELAALDELTRISNRRGFRAVASKAVALCRQLGKPASLLFFDLDNMKQINDRLGHAAGDSALVEMAELLVESFRNSDVVARLGGDEFCVLLAGTAREAMTTPLARLGARVEARNAAAQASYHLAYSVGVVGYDSARHASVDDLLAEADRLMYEQKRARRASR